MKERPPRARRSRPCASPRRAACLRPTPPPAGTGKKGPPPPRGQRRGMPARSSAWRPASSGRLRTGRSPSRLPRPRRRRRRRRSLPRQPPRPRPTAGAVTARRGGPSRGSRRSSPSP
uniref:Uncharacterized protein n=1 Tax=Arundo donax TaxID=35708 RepID=A0A0A9G907_ARUDO